MPDRATRPVKPARPYPLTGEDNSDWHAWWHACRACKHARDRGRCARGGVVTYESGRSDYLAHQVVGGCSDWTPADA